MEAGGGALAGVRGQGFSLIETVGWVFFTIVGFGMLVYVMRDTFVVSIVRDSFNKQKRELYESYREAAAAREHLHHHIEWCRQDGDWQAAKDMEGQLREAEEECRRLAKAIGRKVRRR